MATYLLSLEQSEMQAPVSNDNQADRGTTTATSADLGSHGQILQAMDGTASKNAPERPSVRFRGLVFASAMLGMFLSACEPFTPLLPFDIPKID